MNKFEFFQNVQLADNGAVEVVTVSGMTDATITTPGNQKEFFEQIQLDENGAVKIYIKTGSGPTPTPVPPIATPTATPTPTPTATPTPTPLSFVFAKELLFANCGVLSSDATYYTAGIPILANGVTLYTDNTLTTPVNGVSSTYYAEFLGSSAFATMEISSVGVIFNYTSC